MDMIEKVARAIRATLGGCHGGGSDLSECTYMIIDGNCECTDLARAAIEAMREPTEPMVEASNREWDGRMSHRSSGAWQAMIDAALLPDPPK